MPPYWNDEPTAAQTGELPPPRLLPPPRIEGEWHLVGDQWLARREKWRARTWAALFVVAVEMIVFVGVAGAYTVVVLLRGQG